MSDQDYSKILKEIGEVKKGLQGLEVAVGKIETEIRHELELHKHDSNNTFGEHDRRISFTEKIMLTAGAVILMSVLYAVLRQIGL